MRNTLWFVLFAVLRGAFAQDCTTTVPVNVLTSDTHQPLPFQPEQLQGTLEGRPLMISHLEKIKGNRILILVDVSGSMEKKLPFAKVTFQLLIQNIPPGSSVAYGFFAGAHHLAASFTADTKELSKAVQELNGYRAGGPTALRDAVHEGLRLFKPANPGDSVLLITDGGENHSALEESAMEKELRESGVRFFAIMPSPLPELSSVMQVEEEFGPRWLEEIADKTGGRVFTIYHSWPSMDKKWLQQVAALLQNFWLHGVGGGYLLTVKLPLNLTKPIKWKLRLDTSGDKRLKNATVIYPQKLMPCSNTAAAAP